MKIAVTSQNRREITEHAGRCRNFWVYDVDGLRVVGKTLLELPKESSLHDSSPHAPHPLDGVDVLLTGGMGDGLRMRLARRGIEALVTTEPDPERAVHSWLQGDLPVGMPHAHHHAADAEHGSSRHCGCGTGCGCH